MRGVANMKKLILGAVAGSIVLSGVFAVLPAQTRTQPTQAASSEVITECPPPTDKGAYHSRGIGKDGNVTCGFTYYNACPYFEGAEAGTPECEKGKPTEEQMKPWTPETPATPAPTVSQCGGK